MKLPFSPVANAPALLLTALALTLSSASAAGEPWRPGYHFTPEKNWMNDPNGMVWHDGEWHLFYQYNPFGDKWGHMSWGNAVSKDLLKWEHLPVALAEENGIMIFSGSAVVDTNNTSGFGTGGTPAMVAIYTAHTNTNQSQALAYSNDRGRTWTKYSGNPVLDIGDKDFRDPKVMWHEPSKAWIMTVAWPVERKIRFYQSPDLKKWTHLSDFGPAASTSGIWECPDLLPVQIEGTSDSRWLLIVNVGSGAPAGGSGGQYFIGDFDGTRFTPDPASTPKSTAAVPPEGIVLADFEDGYGDWEVKGEAFGNAPAKGPFPGQHPTPGFLGKGFVNSYLNGDTTQGTLTSPEFKVEAEWISFLIGGGAQPGQTCVNLLVGDEVVRTATGRDDEAMQWHAWKLSDMKGKMVRIQIVDSATGGWGHINADHFVMGAKPARPASDNALWLDHGPDFYAAVTWSGNPPGDDRKILLGWMSNWQYANDVPTKPWRSAMSVPRELSLRRTSDGLRLVQTPVREIASLHTPPKNFAGGTADEANKWLESEKIAGDQMDMEFQLIPGPGGTAGITVFSGTHTGVTITADTTQGTLTLDRTMAGPKDFNSSFPRIAQAPLPQTAAAGPINLRILLDACSVEVFAAKGLQALTALALPPEVARQIRIAPGTSVKAMTIHPLKMDSAK